MANLGKWGALAGLGQGIAQHGQTMREQWLQAAQQKADLEKEGRTNAEADRREKVRADNQATDALTRHNFNVDLEGVRHKNELELEKAKPARADLDKPEFWRTDDVSYKEVNGETFMLPKNGNQWQRVGNPGESMGPPVDPDDLEAQAEDYADKRVKESGDWIPFNDKSQYADYGGSEAKAREAFRQEFIAGRTGQASNVSLDAPPSGQPEADQPPASVVPPNLPQELKGVAERAHAAIDGGAPKDVVVKRLMDAGATAEQIKLMGF